MTVENLTTCSECGAEILARTAAKTGGKCMPCDMGTRADIEASKQRAAEQREKDRGNEAALERLSKKPHVTFGDLLKEKDPVGLLWQYLADVVFRDNEEDLTRLAPGVRSLYFVQILDGEVYNGGFHQYFSNSSGRHAHETLAALTEVGALAAARLLQEAIRAFPSKRVPTEYRERNDQLDLIDDEIFEALDDKYYELADAGTEDLAALVLAFMKHHAGEPVTA